MMARGSSMSLGKVGFALIVLGLGFLATGLWSGLEHLRVLRTWPEAAAEGAGGRVIDYRGEGGRRMFRAEYELRYRLAGREYLIPISSNTSSSFRALAEREVRRYQPGTRHAVRYNPEDPNEIRLNVGFTASYFALPLAFGGIGILVSAAGIGLLRWTASRPAAPRCPSCHSPIRERHAYCPLCSAPLEGFTRPRPEAPPTRAKPATAGLAAGCVFGVAALACLAAAAVTGYRRHQIVSSWPEVEALVSGSQLRRSHTTDGYLVFRPEIEFRYAVAGREYVCSRTSERGSDYAWACRQLARFAPGTHHTVKYDPTDPSQIRFDAAYSLGFFLTPVVTGGVGVIFSLIALALMLPGLPGKRARCPACGAALSGAWKFCPACARPLKP